MAHAVGQFARVDSAGWSLDDGRLGLPGQTRSSPPQSIGYLDGPVPGTGRARPLPEAPSVRAKQEWTSAPRAI